MLTSLGQTGRCSEVCGFALRKGRKAVVLDVVEPRLRPASVVMSATAAVFGGMILYNAFLGQTGPANRLANVPPGTSTHVEVDAPGKTSRTVTLRYDETVEDVQRELLALGRFQGLVDGVSGPQTRVAIETYQRDNNMPVTGEASPQLLEHMRFQRKVSQAADYTGSLTPADAAAPQQPQPAAIAPLADLAPADAAGDEPPPPPLAKPAKPALSPAAKPKAAAQKQVPQSTPDAVPPSGTPGDKAIYRLQQRLAKLGYDPGALTGKLDEGTRSAILIFEMDQGLPMDGKISKALLSALKDLESNKTASQ